MVFPYRVLITGASGYIGRHLTKHLAGKGVRVRGLSRYPQPDQPDCREWFRGDVTRPVDVQQAIEGCDVVIHLACLPLADCLKNPGEAFAVNATGTFNILQAAHDANNVPVVYTTTAQAYSRENKLPLREDDRTQPHTPYAASKLCGELACQTFAKHWGLPVSILRLFNVYGPAVNGKTRPTVETLFLKRALENRPPLIKGNPEEGRDFIHIDDVVVAIELAVSKMPAGKVINIGSGTLTTLQMLARTIIDLVGADLEPDVEPNGQLPYQ
ncbi:MAG: NAD-dependent epimerase/dehydratase family protein, partial [Anaerolineae bacterium]|nr:NAD-dependent epimerase/dehydratase family protein [Anaerolineae bacterium]